MKVQKGNMGTGCITANCDYDIQNTQIWVITQEIFFIFRNHRKINFHLKVSEGNLDHILCPKMHNFGIGQFQLLGYQISAKFKK